MVIELMGLRGHINRLFSENLWRWHRMRVSAKIGLGVYKFSTVDNCICGSNGFRGIADRDRYGLRVSSVICTSCGLILQNPQLTPKSLRRFYRADYRLLYRGTGRIDDQYYHRGIRRGKRIIDFLRKRDLFPQAGTVLEVGCGPAGILKAWSDEGFEVAGCELDAACVSKGAAVGVPVIYGGIEELISAGYRGDVVILSHLFEHVPVPCKFITQLRQLVTANGFVYVEVPGLRNGEVSFADQLRIAHLFCYDANTLHMVFGQGGFDCLYIDESVQGVFSLSSQDAKKTYMDYSENYRLNAKIAGIDLEIS